MGKSKTVLVRKVIHTIHWDENVRAEICSQGSGVGK